MKIKTLSLAKLSMISIIALAGDPIYCKGKGYQGYIFDSSHFVLKSIKHQQGRYTPTVGDIQKAERLLKQKLKTINNNKLNQVSNCPVIHEKLSKYCRQYVGFINGKGKKVIWINLLWNGDAEKSASKDIVNVQDGCSYYWNIEVNIDVEELINLQINGSD